MCRFCLAIVSVWLAASAPSRAANPSDFTIMGIGLRQTPEEVINLLSTQSRHVTSDVESCNEPPASRCVRRIAAKVPDGTLEILFRQSRDPHPLSWQVRLIVNGPVIRDIVLDAATDHFGPPNMNQPAWCVSLRDQNACDPAHASLSFEPGSGDAVVVVLADRK